MIKASTYTSIPMASDIDTVNRLQHYLCELVVAEDGSSHISMLPNAAEICAECEACAYGRRLVELTKDNPRGRSLAALPSTTLAVAECTKLRELQQEPQVMVKRKSRGDQTERWLRTALHPNGIGQEYATMIRNSRRLAGRRL